MTGGGLADPVRSSLGHGLTSTKMLSHLAPTVGISLTLTLVLALTTYNTSICSTLAPQELIYWLTVKMNRKIVFYSFMIIITIVCQCNS